MQGIFIGSNSLNTNQESRDDFFSGIVGFLNEDLKHIKVSHVKSGIILQNYITIKVVSGSMSTEDIRIFCERYPATTFDFQNNNIEVSLIQHGSGRPMGSTVLRTKKESLLSKITGLSLDFGMLIVYIFFIYNLLWSIF